jgi:transcriptional regulator with XRE-family HTH domain
VSQPFGEYIRSVREAKAATDAAFSLRQVAGAVDIEPSYLSKIERGLEPPPGEETIKDIARTLGEDPDVLLALAGKISSDLQAIIRKRPALFAELLRTLRSLPNHAVARVVREVRDGDW